MSIEKNDYDQIADRYLEIHKKPDKYYSILPTVLDLAGNIEGKTVLDLGCGGGFFRRICKARCTKGNRY